MSILKKRACRMNLANISSHSIPITSTQILGLPTVISKYLEIGYNSVVSSQISNDRRAFLFLYAHSNQPLQHAKNQKRDVVTLLRNTHPFKTPFNRRLVIPDSNRITARTLRRHLPSPTHAPNIHSHPYYRTFKEWRQFTQDLSEPAYAQPSTSHLPTFWMPFTEQRPSST